ncbi:hypothetical protein CB1_000381002 [Camelus ferus]|nr:hypothetical protein CB1_000381002 [Camelus ferus]
MPLLDLSQAGEPAWGSCCEGLLARKPVCVNLSSPLCSSEDAMRKAGVAHSKSSKDMESHVFLKAKTRDEYLSLVARLIIHFRDIHPMNALQSLTGGPAAGAAGIGLPSRGPGQPLGGMGGLGALGQPMPLSGQPPPGTSGMAPHGLAVVSTAAPQMNPSAVMSPAGPSQAEEQQYLDKLRQLSKYIEPLRRMINKIDKNEDRKKDLSKMKSLLDILTDPSKRCPLKTLQKCEIALEKLKNDMAVVSGVL